MLNKYFAIGYLGNDPELRYSQSGDPFATFNLAIDDSYRRGEEKIDRTIWMRCVSFGKTAENINNILYKGCRVQVEGSLSLNEWTDREGNARKDLQLRLQNFTSLTPKKDGGDQASRPAAHHAARSTAQTAAPAPDYPYGGVEGCGMDDVPF
jgi:single-strand DNA-binding protein